MTLDSNVIAALFFKDPYSERVEAALEKYDRLLTLDLAFPEVGNVAWKRISLFHEDYATISRALRMATEFTQNACQVTLSKEILLEGLELGVKQELSIYDSLFLTLAKRMRLKLLTTDEKLHRKAQASKELANLTILP